eukprot:1351030-Pleurochrysis_carterae.AAC.1
MTRSCVSSVLSDAAGLCARRAQRRRPVHCARQGLALLALDACERQGARRALYDGRIARCREKDLAQ